MWSFNVLTFLFLTLAQVNAKATAVPLFDFENVQLSPRHAPVTGPLLHRRQTNSSCKIFPGDASWPTDAEWAALNNTLDGALLQPVPLASVCYNNTVYNDYSVEQCADLTAKWYAIAR